MVTATTKPAPTHRLQTADDLKETKKFDQAIVAYKEILVDPSVTEDGLREKEHALSQLGQLYRDQQ